MQLSYDYPNSIIVSWHSLGIWYLFARLLKAWLITSHLNITSPYVPISVTYWHTGHHLLPVDAPGRRFYLSPGGLPRQYDGDGLVTSPRRRNKNTLPIVPVWLLLRGTVITGVWVTTRSLALSSTYQKPTFLIFKATWNDLFVMEVACS